MKISSMTAFARHQAQTSCGTFTWEIRAVNHRYLELQTRLPENLRDIENSIRDKTRKSINRGKIECNLRFQPSNDDQQTLQLNEALAQHLVNAAQQVAKLSNNPAPINPTDIMRWPGVLTPFELDSEEIKQAALSSFDELLTSFQRAREREGGQLAQLIKTRLTSVLAEIEKVKLHLPEIQSALRQKLVDRFAEAQVEIDTARLEQELVYLAQKIDVDEELDRINTHVQEIHRILEQGGVVGRRLDFLMQELNREANTLGSKSVNTASTQSSVEIKVLVEQMREQIQNIE